jgi:hypothetical protein
MRGNYCKDKKMDNRMANIEESVDALELSSFSLRVLLMMSLVYPYLFFVIQWFKFGNNYLPLSSQPKNE